MENSMTPEARAKLVFDLRNTNSKDWTLADCVRAVLQIAADGETLLAQANTIACLTAERDAAQAEIKRLAKINVKLCADFNLMNQHGAKQDMEIAGLSAGCDHEQRRAEAAEARVKVLEEALQDMISGYEEHDVIDRKATLRELDRQTSWIQRATAALKGAKP